MAHIVIYGYFFGPLVLIALIAWAAIHFRKLPAISIPIGILFMVPFVWGMAEDYFHGRDNSVGAMFVPLILLVFFLLALLGAFLFFSGMRRLKPMYEIVLVFGLLILTISMGALFFTRWSQANINYVVESAEKIADNEPYCIDVVSGNSYKEAVSLSDFSGSRMRAPHSWGWYAGPHAILAIGSGVQPDIYHWSYRGKSFIKDDGSKSPVYCNPRSHFATTFSGEQTAELFHRFRFAGMHLSIPPIYRASIFNGSSNPTITFYATAPNFESAPEVGRADAIYSHIELNFADTDRTDVWHTKDGPAYIVEESGEEYGLKKQAKWYVGSGRRREKSGVPSFQYFNISSDNKIVTVIDCPDSVRGECLHAFRSGGWTYTFHHRPVYLAEWKTMQEKLVKLTRSFIKKN